MEENARKDSGGRAGASDGTIVALHFSPVLIAKRRDAEAVRLDPEALAGAIRRICDAESAEILRSDLSPSHVHLLLRIPPKHSVRSVLPRLRQALSYRLLKEYRKHPEDYWALHLWEWKRAAWGRSDLDEVEVTCLKEETDVPVARATWVSPFSGGRKDRRPPSREAPAGARSSEIEEEEGQPRDAAGPGGTGRPGGE